MGTKILIPWKIRIGKNSIVNEFCFLDGRGGLTIGDNVSISIYSIIITGSHDKNSKSFKYISKGVVIEDSVWLGARAMILEGSILKHGTVIGAGSVYKGFSEENAVYIGIPATMISKRKYSDYSLNYRPFFR